MSGPKVVRIITREEILEICQGLLARVDAALDEWTRIGRRNNCIDEEALAVALRRRDTLAALIAHDRFTELQKQAQQEEAFIRQDLQMRLTAVAAKQAAARARERREREAAAALLKHLRISGVPIDTVLEAGLERGDPATTSRGLLLLDSGSAKADGFLAGKLRDGDAPRSYADWLAAQPSVSADPAFERIEARIAEIIQLKEPSGLKAWRARLQEAGEAADARRDLILDSLEIETGRALNAARADAKATFDLKLVLVEAAAGGIDIAPWTHDLDELAADDLAARTEKVRSAFEESRKRKAVEARRAALLEGLSGLGYEVREGMSTSWASEGRLVLRSAFRPDYGVEVSGSERFQMRPVAFDSNGRGPNPSNDRDAETIWCGDVGSLEKRLAELGGALRIEKSAPIGAVPLKRVATGQDLVQEGAEAPILREKTLR